MAISPNTPLSGLPLPFVNEDGTRVLDTRVKDVAGARSLWAKQRDADLQSNIEMAKVQAMADGEQPFNQAQRRATSQAYLSNFNPNDFKALLDTSLAAYTDLISADETLIDVFTTHGTLDEREMWSSIMSKHMSRRIRSWPKFLYKYSYIPHYFTLHGVGIGYFEDCYNWQWQVANLGTMKVPRDVEICEDDLPYAFIKSKAKPQDLLRYVNNEQYASDEGWNIPAIKLALMQTAPQYPDGFNWMEYEQLWKNNDIVYGENAPTIPVIYSWFKENDGSISIYVFTETALDNPGGQEEKFLCVKRHAYATAQEAFVFFARGIGTNATLHSVRGLGSDIYNAMQALMRLENRKVDLASSVGPIFQVEDEEQMQSALATPWGPFTLVSKGLNVLQVSPPQLSATIEPAVQSLRQTIQQNVGQYTSSNALQTGREMTKAETLARLEQTAALSVTAINLFNQSMDRLCREVARRFTRKGYQRSDPGGHYVHDWRRDCVAEGVPEEALHKIDHARTRAARIIGFGSPAARRVALQMVMELYDLMDDVGKAKAVRKVTAATVGWEQAREFFPDDGVRRVPVDAQIAELQNNELARGGEVTVSPSENKRVHLEVHTGRIGQIIQQFDEAGQNPELFAQIVPELEAIYSHAAETLEVFTGPEAPMFRQALQNAGETLVNGIRHLQKLERQQMEQGGADGQPGDPAAMAEQQKMTDEIERRVIEHQVKLRMGAEAAEQKLAIEAARAAQQRSLADADMAAKILRETAAAQARTNSQQAA